MMKKHGLRRFFSLLLAVFMVCTLLPTAALAEDTTGDDETQPKTVVVDEGEKKTDPPAPEEPKTFTVTYTDGADDSAFAKQVYSNLSSGTPTPTFSGTLAREDYTFAGWNPEVAETVTGDVTYVAKWEAVKNARTVHNAPPKPNSTVVLHPSVNNTVTGVKVSVGGTLSGYTIKSISGYDITVDLGTYNVNNGTFRLPYAKDIWYGVDDNKVDYISWAGSGSNTRSEGASALLANGKNTAYYYFKGAPVLPTFTLNYDANGGTGAPASQTHKATSQNEKSHEFTISSQKPTRENYTFLGWSANRNATTAEYQPNGRITVTSTTTLYAVWKKDAPAQPTPLDEAGVKALLGDNAVQIICTNAQSGHGSRTFGLIDGTFNVYKSNNRRYEVVINYFSPYVDAFNAAVNVPAETHITDNSNAGQNRTKINLVWSDGKWTADARAKYHVLCSTQPAEPTAPTEDWFINAYKTVTVNCTNTPAGHGSESYNLVQQSIAIGEPTYDSTSKIYSCVVTVTSTSYVAQFNGTKGTHAPETDTASRTVYSTDGKNWVAPSPNGSIEPIVFNVVCDTKPEPTTPGVGDLEGIDNLVRIVCDRNVHETKTYGVIADSCDFAEVVKTNGEYTCNVTINAPKYVEKYNEDVTGVTHTLVGNSSKHLALRWNADELKWKPMTDTPVTFEVTCPPAAPGHDNLTRLIGDIAVNCTNNAATHTPRREVYTLLTDSYTPGKVEGTADTGYTFTVTVNAEKYVTRFDTDTNATHTPKGGSKVVTLQYVNDAWTVKEVTPVSFNVTCVAQPTFDDLKKIFDQNIFVECTTKSAHAKTPYDLIDGSYTIEAFSTMTDSPTCTVVLHSREYVKLFNGTIKAVHTPENEDKRVKLVLRAGGWGVAKDDELPVVFQVSCVPDAPADNYLKDLLNREVTVTCTTNAAHAPAEYGLLDDSYRVSGVQPDGNGGYTYTVTIAAAEYVKKYNTERQRNHSLVKDEPTEKPVTLVWNANEHEWGFDAVPVNFNVECLYTVTYEDGEKGSVFKTVSFLNLKKGEATPTIEDPIRVGYEFAGWRPNVQKTVTGDATYTAQWEAVDTTFTVKYNDNVKGKAFKEQVYENLKYNEETPDFYGTPKRSGYTFTGWKPVVADRVTKDVTYYAQWKSNSGKDKVPKTGDGQIVMILGSVLLFSFCGATAVYLNDRKRKQG